MNQRKIIQISLNDKEQQMYEELKSIFNSNSNDIVFEVPDSQFIKNILKYVLVKEKEERV